MDISRIPTGIKLAVGVYAGVRLLDLCIGGQWKGRDRELGILLRTLPQFIRACDQLVDAAREVGEILVTAPDRKRTRARRKPGAARRSTARARG